MSWRSKSSKASAQVEFSEIEITFVTIMSLTRGDTSLRYTGKGWLKRFRIVSMRAFELPQRAAMCPFSPIASL